MRAVQAQLIHDMQNTAMVLREAGSQLHENRDSLPPAEVAHLSEIVARRSDMLVRLLGDLSISHLAGRGELDLSLQRVSLPEVCRDQLAERQPSIGELDADVAESGHSVAFWHADEGLAGCLVAYVANGLAAGEAVLVAATPAHHKLLETGLAAIGIDAVAATASGQSVPLDANSVHNDLPRLHGIDRERFDLLIGETVGKVSSRWPKFRVFGEIVDLYCSRGDNDLALDLEACWNELRARLPFPLLCGYELAPGGRASAICDCHDIVVPA